METLYTIFNVSVTLKFIQNKKNFFKKNPMKNIDKTFEHSLTKIKIKMFNIINY